MDGTVDTDRGRKEIQRQGEAAGGLFQGIRFVLAGFDPVTQNEYAAELKHNGAFDVERYDASCTHVIVYQLIYDDPICAAARKDGKALVTHSWVADSLARGVLADTNKILYRPVRDIIGIPSSASLCICLTGYQSQDRRDIMRMVEIMGAQFTKPLIASKVTHLICYKFEGDKYRLAKQMGLKLVNHRWLEDCLKVWALLPEENYLKSGWEVELLEAEARDSEDDRVSRSCLPMLSTHNQESGSHSTSLHGPFVMPNSKPPPHPMSNELVSANEELLGTKLSSKELTEPRTYGELERNQKLLDIESRGELTTRKCHSHLMLAGTNEENKSSGRKKKEVDVEIAVCIEPPEMSNHKKEVAGMTGLDGVQSAHKHSIKITDIGSGNKPPKASDVCLENLKGERQIPSINCFLQAHETTAVHNEKDSIGGMALVDQDIQISADDTSAIRCSAAKSPWKFGAGRVLNVESNQTLEGSSPTHLMNELCKSGIPDALLPKVKKSLSSGYAQNNNADAHETTDRREREAFEKEYENGFTFKTNEAKQQSENVTGRSLTADHQSETASGNAKMQTCQDGLSMDCNSNFKKATDANVGSIFSNASSSLEKSSHPENVVSPVLAEETSTKTVIFNSREFYHVAKDQTHDLENRNVVSHFDGCGEKTSAKAVEQTEERKLSNNIIASPCYSKLERPTNKKRPRQPKVSGPKKRENTLSGDDLKICTNRKCPDEMDKSDLSVERENLDNEMAEIKKKFNNVKTPSVHTPGGLCSETLNISASLLQLPAHGSSTKGRRNLGLTRKTGVEETQNLNTNVENSNSRKDKPEFFDLNVPTSSILSHSPLFGLGPVGAEVNKSSADLTPVSGPEMLSGSIDNKPLQSSGERGSIYGISEEKLPSKILRKRSSKKGRHPCNEITVVLEIPDQSIKENEELGKVNTAVIQDVLVDGQHTFHHTDEKQLQFSGERGLFSSTGNILLDVSEEKCPSVASKKKSGKRGRPIRNKIAAGVEMLDQSTVEFKDLEKADTAAIQDELVDAEQTSGNVETMKAETKSTEALFMEQKVSAFPVSGVPASLPEEVETPFVELPRGNGFISSSNRSNARRKPPRGRPKLSDVSTVKVDSNTNADKPSFELINGNNHHDLQCGVLSSQPKFAEKGDSGLGALKITENLPCIKEELNENQEQTKDENVGLATPLTKGDVKLLANERGTRNTSRASRGKKAKGSVGISIKSVKEELHEDEVAADHIHGRKDDLGKSPHVSSKKAVNMKLSTNVSQRTRQGSQNAKLEKIKFCNTVKLEGSTSKTIVHAEPRLFILAGHRLERKEFKILIKHLGGRLCKDSHQWSYQATHLVAPEPLRRTEKFFAAAAAGRWILTTEYLRASKNAGRFLDEHEYEWHKNGLSEDGTISFEAPRKWRLLRENTGCCAFHGLRIIIYGDCIAPPLDTLKRVVKAGGGAILATRPPYNRFLAAGVDFAIISPGIPRDDIWIQEFLRHDIACVLVDYLVEYVCKPSHPIEKHVLYNTHAAVKRSLKCLEMNIQSAASDWSEGTHFVENRKDNKVKKEQFDEIYCSVCRSADRDDVMLLCGDEQGRGCGTAMHIDCCQPPLASVPEEDWFCPNCQLPGKMKKQSTETALLKRRNENNLEEEQNDEIYCTVCKSADRGDVMLLCGDENGRGCGSGVHIDCCQPPLDSVPEEDWFCSKCQIPDKPKKKSSKRTKRL